MFAKRKTTIGKEREKTDPVLLRTSIAGAKAPTPGNIRRLAFRMSFGVCTCLIFIPFFPKQIK